MFAYSAQAFPWQGSALLSQQDTEVSEVRCAPCGGCQLVGYWITSPLLTHQAHSWICLPRGVGNPGSYHWPTPVLGHFSGVFSSLLLCSVLLSWSLIGLDSRGGKGLATSFCFQDFPLVRSSHVRLVPKVQPFWKIMTWWAACLRSDSPGLALRWITLLTGQFCRPEWGAQGSGSQVRLLERKQGRAQQKTGRKGAQARSPWPGAGRGWGGDLGQRTGGNLRLTLGDLMNIQLPDKMETAFWIFPFLDISRPT